MAQGGGLDKLRQVDLPLLQKLWDEHRPARGSVGVLVLVLGPLVRTNGEPECRTTLPAEGREGGTPPAPRYMVGFALASVYVEGETPSEMFACSLGKVPVEDLLEHEAPGSAGSSAWLRVSRAVLCSEDGWR